MKKIIFILAIIWAIPAKAQVVDVCSMQTFYDSIGTYVDFWHNTDSILVFTQNATPIIDTAQTDHFKFKLVEGLNYFVIYKPLTNDFFYIWKPN